MSAILLAIGENVSQKCSLFLIIIFAFAIELHVCPFGVCVYVWVYVFYERQTASI